MEKRFVLPVAAAVLLSGCFNLATKPDRITGAYVSPLRYTGYTCDQLAVESSSLARREAALTTAQQHRRKSDKLQAFWLGFGTGDGIEASELSSIRGDVEAVRQASELKQCGRAGVAAATASEVPTGEVLQTSAPLPSAQPCAACDRILKSHGR